MEADATVATWPRANQWSQKWEEFGEHSTNWHRPNQWSQEWGHAEAQDDAMDGKWAGQWEAEEDVRDPWYIDAHDLVLTPSAPDQHLFTLVLLHSCSGGPDDWLPFFHRLDLPFRGQVRAVVPCAPVRIEEHYGWRGEMNSWFEYEDDGGGLKHPAQLLEQRERILKLLEVERQQLPGGDSRRLVLGGLSQGVSLALDVAFHAPFVVGGVIALRGMALRTSLDGLRACQEGARTLEVLAVHGARDKQCSVEEAKASYEAVTAKGARLHFVVEPLLGHACARGRQRLCGPELRRINQFLREVWGELGDSRA